MPIFLIERNAAFRLRFDFRLEVEGMLASWAVPKGPSADPRDRRLATRTEDHPLAYDVLDRDLRAGALWDIGRYRNLTDLPVSAALAAGHVTIALAGRKLSGTFGLTMTGIRGKENWLLARLDR